MNRIRTEGESITVDLDKHNIPIRFNYLGSNHRIDGIRQCREIDIGWWSDDERVHRTIFALTTNDGLLCSIYYDHLDQNWYFERFHD